MPALFRATKTAEFDRLYRQHAASVFRYAFAVLGSRADAEDVAQQTFLKAYSALAQGTKPRKAENWLLTIAHGKLVDVRSPAEFNGEIMAPPAA